MSRILITGGAGFIGYFLAKRLSGQAGNNIVLVDDLSRGRKDPDFEKLIEMKNLTLLVGDVTDASFVSGLPTDIDYIYHMAAVVGVNNVVKAPARALKVNTVSTINMFEYARKVKSLNKFFFASTSEVYSGTMRHLAIKVPTPEDVLLALDDITRDRTVYALSKMCGESAGLVYGKEFGIPVTIGRYHNVYGPRMGFDHVIPEMFVKISLSPEVEVASPGHTRSFCYVDDAVEFTMRVTEDDKADKEIFHIGNPGEEVAIKDLVAKIARIMDRKIAIKELPDTAGSPPRRCPDTSKIERLTGYRAAVSLEDGIRRTYDWYKDKIKWN